MSFNLPVAYAIAAVAITILVWVAKRDRRAGWRREREDSLTDNLLAWAEAESTLQSQSTGSRPMVQPPQAAESLSALSAALQVYPGKRAAIPVEPAETEPVRRHVSANAVRSR